MAQRNPAPRHVVSLGAGVHRVQQLQLDAGQRDDRRGDDRHPRPIAGALGAVVRGLLPDPSEAHQLVELTAPERRRLFDLCQLDPLRRAELEDAVRRAVARRYRKAA